MTWKVEERPGPESRDALDYGGETMLASTTKVKLQNDHERTGVYSNRT